MNDANPLTLVGLVLTLASLVGSFFYIQLSQWLRDILAVAAKIQIHEHGESSDKDKAIREAKIEHRKLGSWHLIVTNLVVIGFVGFLIWTGFRLIDAAQSDPSYPVIRLAFSIFGVVFAGMSIFLFSFGMFQLKANGTSLGLSMFGATAKAKVTPKRARRKNADG